VSERRDYRDDGMRRDNGARRENTHHQGYSSHPNHGDHRRPPRKKKGGAKRALLIALCVFLVLVLTLLILGTAYMESLLGMINKVDKEQQETMSQEEYQQMLAEMQETVDENYTGEMLEDVDWEEHDGLLEDGEDIINILLIGQDRRAGEGRSRSDVIILCTVNKPAKTVTLTSFMRDMYVQIPGYDDNRINAPYVYGGMELLDECLRVNFGVEVDGNVEVDFQSFIGVVDLMGGIEMELTAEEADYMNGNYSFDVDYHGTKEWNLTEGVQHLNGAQALSYARMRYVGRGDYERTNRQRKVLSALMEKAKSLSLSELNVIMQHVLPMLTTDMENSEMIGYALELFPMLPDLKINTLRIPADGSHEMTYIRQMSVLLPDLAENRELLEQVMNGTYSNED